MTRTAQHEAIATFVREESLTRALKILMNIVREEYGTDPWARLIEQRLAEATYLAATNEEIE